VISQRAVQRRSHRALDQHHVIVPVPQRFLHLLELAEDHGPQCMPLRLGRFQGVAQQLAGNAELVWILMGTLPIRTADLAAHSLRPLGKRVELQMQRLRQQRIHRFLCLLDFLTDVPPRAELGQRVGTAERVLRLSVLAFPLAFQLRLKPNSRRPVSGVGFEFAQMPDHHVQIAQRPKPAAKLFEHLLKCLAMLVGQHFLQQPHHRLQPAGGHAGIVDPVLIKLFQRLGHIVMEILHELVEVGEKAEIVVLCHR